MKKEEFGKPILITGIHRSGTTWVGKILTHDPRVTYISEPLHLRHSLGVFNQPVDAWYPYICDENGEPFENAFLETIQYKYHLGKELQNLHSFREVGKLVRDFSVFQTSRLGNHRALLKDPFAVVSVPWFLSMMKADVVILVRHPLQFVSSIKRLNWKFDFDYLLQQPLLMRDYLEPYRVEMNQVNRKRDDIVGEGILLWKIIYSIVNQYQKKGHDFMLVRHEDLSLDPERYFSDICDYVGVNYSRDIKRAIIRSSRSSNLSEIAVHDEHSFIVNSIANLTNWKKRLTDLEIERIVTDTRDIAEKYYKWEEWNLW